jgi:hypothetical protein
LIFLSNETDPTRHRNSALKAEMAGAIRGQDQPDKRIREMMNGHSPGFG